MLKFDNISIWVHDQDEALAFYTDMLGFEVRFDITIASGFRWLEIALPDHDTGLVLGAIPGGAPMDAATEQQLRSIVGKGLSGTILLTTEDCFAEAERLRARGVEFIQEPTD
ncbi:MAG: Glyoxalase/bleomycin resistance protein/dioxygenase, partial [Thermoleophilia bacterium]|nr:Glyoxalase/bleomycin resistance protein/dioxygenase [Thermoleophilia bacterium]